MKIKTLVNIVLLLVFWTFAFASEKNYTINDLQELVPSQTEK